MVFIVNAIVLTDLQRWNSTWQAVAGVPMTLLLLRTVFGIAVVRWSAVPVAVCTRAQAPTSLPNPAIVPADRRQHSRWADRHKAVVEAMHSHPDAQLLLIGDSIIDNYDVLLKLRLYR